MTEVETEADKLLSERERIGTMMKMRFQRLLNARLTKLKRKGKLPLALNERNKRVMEITGEMLWKFCVSAWNSASRKNDAVTLFVMGEILDANFGNKWREKLEVVDK